jgi:hypothetical protein
MIALWLALLALGGLAMWTAIPLAWLWIASQAGGPLLLIAGTVTTMVAWGVVLGAVNRRYQDARVRRGLDDTGNFPLEVTLVCSAAAAGAALLAGWILHGS